jgi:alanine-glyoxylate transaminase / serine-glyoxylate transaminase / serine-pyruvate transaminase
VPNDFDSEDAVKTAYHRHRLPVEGRRQVFRIGQAGHMNEAMILQALAGCEMATRDVGIRLAAGSGVAAAEEHFRTTAPNRWQLDRSRDRSVGSHS